MENESSARTPGAPYVSFKTFQSGVQSLRTHGLPEKIDRSVWASKSGADQDATGEDISANEGMDPLGLQQLACGSWDTGEYQRLLPCQRGRDRYADVVQAGVVRHVPGRRREHRDRPQRRQFQRLENRRINGCRTSPRIK